MIYIQLFISFLKIGAFSFGGGYAAMPLIQNEVVTIHNWMSISEFTDLITISQMTPGPIAINSATFVGTKIAGVLGATVATIGCILPSCIIVTALARLYIKYKNLDILQGVLKTLRPAVVAMIATAGVSIIVSSFFPEQIINIQYIKIIPVLIFTLSMILLIKYKMNAITVMIIAGLINVLQAYIIGVL